MKVTVKLFARMRELAGTSSMERDIPSGATIADLIEGLQQDFLQLTDVASHTVVAVNQEFADTNTLLAEGDEVAFFPPVSGGTDAKHSQNGKFAVTFDPIGLDDIAAGHDCALYASTAGSSISRFESDGNGLSFFATPGGRPLGLEVDSHGNLLVANSHLGLQRIRPDG